MMSANKGESMKFVFALLIALSSYQLFACSCRGEIPSASEVPEGSHSVFLGIPIEDSVIIEPHEYNPTLKTKFSIVRSYKNASEKTIDVISSGDSGSNCGVSFEKGSELILVQTYLEDDGRESTSSCSVDYASDNDVELPSRKESHV
jgi:hypothetical protein